MKAVGWAMWRGSGEGLPATGHYCESLRHPVHDRICGLAPELKPELWALRTEPRKTQGSPPRSLAKQPALKKLPKCF